jgi:hypothetical protein
VRALRQEGAFVQVRLKGHGRRASRIEPAWRLERLLVSRAYPATGVGNDY